MAQLQVAAYQKFKSRRPPIVSNITQSVSGAYHGIIHMFQIKPIWYITDYHERRPS